MASTMRDAGRETFWRDLAKRQASSGLSVRAFCRREKLGESNFYAWRRTIAERDLHEARGRKKRQSAGCDGKRRQSKAGPAFVPVSVNGRLEYESGIVLELGGGRRLRLSESIEPDRLAAIVHALEGEAMS